MSAMSLEDKDKVYDEIQLANPSGKRYDAYTCGYLMEWVNQLQQDIELLKLQLETEKLNQLDKEKQEWFHQQDCDEQWRQENE